MSAHHYSIQPRSGGQKIHHTTSFALRTGHLIPKISIRVIVSLGLDTKLLGQTYMEYTLSTCTLLVKLTPGSKHHNPDPIKYDEAALALPWPCPRTCVALNRFLVHRLYVSSLNSTADKFGQRMVSTLEGGNFFRVTEVSVLACIETSTADTNISYWTDS